LTDLERFVRVGNHIYGDSVQTPKLVLRSRAILRVLADEPLEMVVSDTGLPKHHLRVWVQALSKDGLYGWLGKTEPRPERIQRAKGSVAQMFLGSLAEEHFESLAHDALGQQGFHITDDRVGRTDTDYRLLDSNEHPVCRFNIKFHGTLFRESREYVRLDPKDCFALATYKIHGALRRQDQEFLPYVFLIISVPEFPRKVIEESISDDLAWLSALSGRSTEEQIVTVLAKEPWAEDIRVQIRSAEFRVISARRADQLLKERLFERVHALRLRGFNRTFRGAEINMHLSLSKEMMAFSEFLQVLARTGVQGLSVRLERGEI